MEVRNLKEERGKSLAKQCDNAESSCLDPKMDTEVTKVKLEAQLLSHCSS